MHTPHAPAAEGDDWISIEDAADLCRVSTNTERAWMRTNACVCAVSAQGEPRISRAHLYARLHRVALCVNIS